MNACNRGKNRMMDIYVYWFYFMIVSFLIGEEIVKPTLRKNVILRSNVQEEIGGPNLNNTPLNGNRL